MGVVKHGVELQHLLPGLAAFGVAALLIQGQALMHQVGVIRHGEALQQRLVAVEHVEVALAVHINGDGIDEQARAGTILILSAEVEQAPAVPGVFHDVAQLVDNEDVLLRADGHINVVVKAPAGFLHDVDACHVQPLDALHTGGDGVDQAARIHVQGGGRSGDHPLELRQLLLGVGEALELLGEAQLGIIRAEVPQEGAVRRELGNAVGVALGDDIHAAGVVHRNFEGLKLGVHAVKGRAGMLQDENLLPGFHVVNQYLLELDVGDVELAVSHIDAAGLLEFLVAEGTDPFAVQRAHQDALVALVGDEQAVLLIHEHIRRTLEGLVIKLRIGAVREITGGRMGFLAGIDLRQGVVGRFVRPGSQGQKRQTEQQNQNAFETHGVLPFLQSSLNILPLQRVMV